MRASACVCVRMSACRLHESFIKSVPIMSGLNEYERLTIADALTSVTFDAGDVRFWGHFCGQPSVWYRRRFCLPSAAFDLQLFRGVCGGVCVVDGTLGGQVVISEGEPGNDFYIIEEGEAKATKAGVDGEVSRRLTVGDYFGERALLTNEVRACVRPEVATCTRTTLVL